MADKKVSELTPVVTIDPEDLFLVIKPASPNNLMTHATGEQLRDFCTGAFLSANTARVDPSGDDATGTIGDLSKPFLTVQAAVDAFEAKFVANPGDDQFTYLIDIGNSGTLAEDLTTSLQAICFKGPSSNGNSTAFASLTFSEPAERVWCFLYNTNGGNINADTPSILLVSLDDCAAGNIVNTSGEINVNCDYANGQTGDIASGGAIRVFGLEQTGTLNSTVAADINVASCLSRRGNFAAVDINSPGSAVTLTSSIIGSITSSGALTLIDSRVFGTNNATSTVYADVLLAGTPGNIDIPNRKLINSSGTPALYWNLDTVGDGSGFAGAAFGYLLTPIDPDNNIGRRVIDLQNGYLYDVNGDELLRWFGGNVNIEAVNGLFVDKIANYGSDEAANIDLLNRKLYASDGTTVNADYSSPFGPLMRPITIGANTGTLNNLAGQDPALIFASFFNVALGDPSTQELSFGTFPDEFFTDGTYIEIKTSIGSLGGAQHNLIYQDADGIQSHFAGFRVTKDLSNFQMSGKSGQTEKLMQFRKLTAGQSSFAGTIVATLDIDGNWVATSFTGDGSALTLDASGFNGNLTTTDNTLQEVAQKVDDLVIGASGAPTGATYITQTHDATLSAEQALGDLASGLMQVTTTTGVITSTLTPTIASATVTDSVNGIALQTAGAGKSILKAATTNASNTSFAMPFIASGGDTLVSKTSTDTLTNKTLTAPSISTATVTDTVNGVQFQTAGAGISFVKAATSQAFNSGFALPTLSGAGNDTLVSKTSTDTLTNKTLTSPTLTTAVLTGLPTGTGVDSASTASTLVARDTNANISANNVNHSYTTTATAAGTTTLTVASTNLQYFTGTTTQSVLLPVASTLVLGQQFIIANQSTGFVTVKSSGSNTVALLYPGAAATTTCILTSGTTAASWSVSYSPSFNSTTAALAITTNTGSTGAKLEVGNTGYLLTGGSQAKSFSFGQSDYANQILIDTGGNVTGATGGVVIAPQSDNAAYCGTTANRWKQVNTYALGVSQTITAGGTTGAQTINKAAGTVNFAAAASTLVVTNSLVTTSSSVYCTVRTADATAYIKSAVPASGSFTITLGAAATAETSVGFFVIN